MTRPRTNGLAALTDRFASERGFSLVEVMAAVVVVSIAALGFAGLQTVTLRNNTNALRESQAATLAQDVLESMRANPAANYATAFGAAIAIGGVQCEGVGANCTPAQVALYDLTRWKCALGAAVMNAECAARSIPGQLPNGDGQIVVAGNVVTVTVRWFDATGNASRSLVFDTVM